jgi:UDP-N-acetylmuramate dehydrogenase
MPTGIVPLLRPCQGRRGIRRRHDPTYGGDHLVAGIPLAPLTTLRLGGPAGRLAEAATEAALVDGVREADAAGTPLLVLAGGSNVVIADAGFPGTVVRVATRGVHRDGERLVVQAGEPWDPLVAGCVADGLQGFECLSGIPGSAGATPIQNVGAYGQEVSETVEWVRVLDRSTDSVHELPAAECGFSYRGSVFRHRDRWVVLAVAFRLRRSERSGPLRYAELARALGVSLGETAPLGDLRDAVLALRRGKGMVIDPADPDSVSVGSFFTNPVLSAGEFDALRARADATPPAWPQDDGQVKTSAAWLIERAGFRRGHEHGRAAISTKHTLALVNRGGASAAELVGLAREIATGVRERFGVRLQPEPVLVGFTWD